MPSMSESTAVMMQTSALSLSDTTIESRSAACVSSLTRMSYQYVENRPEAGNDVRPREPWNESSRHDDGRPVHEHEEAAEEHAEHALQLAAEQDVEPGQHRADRGDADRELDQRLPRRVQRVDPEHDERGREQPLADRVRVLWRGLAEATTETESRIFANLSRITTPAIIATTRMDAPAAAAGRFDVVVVEVHLVADGRDRRAADEADGREVAHHEHEDEDEPDHHARQRERQDDLAEDLVRRRAEILRGLDGAVCRSRPAGRRPASP